MTRFLQKWLLVLAWLHLAIGLAIPFIAYSALFDSYSARLQQAFWPGLTVPPETLAFQRWIVSLFGPTLASVGVVMIWLVRAGIRSGEAWPWRAILAALAIWAPGDVYISMTKDFWLHVWIDAAALLTIVPPVLILMSQAQLTRRSA
jgi:hypothetical protein